MGINKNKEMKNSNPEKSSCYERESQGELTARYTVGKVFGRGSTCNVLLARDKLTREMRAIKL